MPLQKSYKKSNATVFLLRWCTFTLVLFSDDVLFQALFHWCTWALVIFCTGDSSEPVCSNIPVQGRVGTSWSIRVCLGREVAKPGDHPPLPLSSDLDASLTLTHCLMLFFGSWERKLKVESESKNISWHCQALGPSTTASLMGSDTSPTLRHYLMLFSGPISGSGKWKYLCSSPGRYKIHVGEPQIHWLVTKKAISLDAKAKASHMYTVYYTGRWFQEHTKAKFVNLKFTGS